MWKTVRVLASLCLFLLSFDGSTLADQFAASSLLGPITFSGPVTPTLTAMGAFVEPIAPIPGGAFCVFSTTTWAPSSCTANFGGDFAFTSADSVLAAIAAASVGFSSDASLERNGTIVVSNTSISCPPGFSCIIGIPSSGGASFDISAPFSGIITPTQVGTCGPDCNYQATVSALIFLPFPGGGFAENAIIKSGDFKESDGTISIAGPLDLALNLQPGTYPFSITVFTDVTVTPERSNVLLLGIGLLGLAGISRRKRFNLGARAVD
jgi:hypothetical protein